MRDLTAVKTALRQHEIELPCRAFGTTGTRFKVFGQPGVPRTPWEKADDAAQVHRFTGVAPSMAVHIPWDRVDDYAELAAYARGHGIRIGTVNANVFQDDDYKLGSVCNPDPRVREKALRHLLACVDVMDASGSRDLKLWFADGTNYPGQDDIAARQDRLAEALQAVYARLAEGQRMLLEYKLFEPSFYTTDVPDLGTSLLHCQALGHKAQVVVDTGHHAPGTNIEFIVALLLRAGRLGGFDFNSRFYADDDLMVGAADPFQLFRIMHEVVKAAAGEHAPLAGCLARRPAQTVRCILDSLALAYRRTIRAAQALSGRHADVVHIVGGGTRNALLCQLTADACELPVIAGPAEATALGNVLVQGRAGRGPGDLAGLRALRATQPQRRYTPSGNAAAWASAQQRLSG